MEGLLKEGPFFRGLGKYIVMRDAGQIVQIKETEDHPIYGKRYKIIGLDEWLEQNCFEYIKE